MNRRPYFLILFCLLFGSFILSEQENLSAQSEGGGIVSVSAQIAADETALYSAPGTGNYYATGTLKEGDKIEVFYKTGDGWYAVRPPQGSYSWISGNFIQLGQNGKGTVISPDNEKEVPVRVGADSVLKSTGVQVGLKTGRSVTIVGETTLTGGKKWYKILPPAGEFRWVREESLVPNEYLARVTDHLTREGEFNALTVDSDGNGTAETLPNALVSSSRRVIAEPETTEQNNSFHLELAQLQRDLFIAVQNSQAPESYDLLADRAAALFNAASDDQERTEVQKIYQKIKAYRNGTIPSSRINGVQGGAYAQTIYEHPLNRVGAENGIVARGHEGYTRRPTLRSEEQQLTFTPPEKQKTNGGEKKSEMKFAFADGGPFSGLTKSKKNNSQLSILPPANYRVSPEMLSASGAIAFQQRQNVPMIGEMVAQRQAALPEPSVRNEPAMLAARPQALPDTHSVQQPAQQPVQNPPAMLPNNAPLPGPNVNALPSTARPVSAETQEGTNAHIKTPEEADGWHAPNAPNPPKTLNVIQETAPQTTDKTSSVDIPDDGRFDAVGVLGYFPDHPSGYPPYALTRNDGDKIIILSYVTPEKGKNLDSWIGKKVGINGTRGWFKRGSDNRRMITARAVFDLES